MKAELIRYSFSPELPVSDIYEVTVKGTPVPVIKTRIGSCLNFGMTAPVDVTITLTAPPKDAVIRPTHAGVKAENSGRKCTFRLPRPLNLSVEFDGNLACPFFVFANPELKNPPSKDDPKVRCIEAGKVHKMGEIKLQDGEFVESALSSYIYLYHVRDIHFSSEQSPADDILKAAIAE